MIDSDEDWGSSQESDGSTSEFVWDVLDEWNIRRPWVNKQQREASPMTWVEGLPTHLFKQKFSHRSSRRIEREMWFQKRFNENREKFIGKRVLKELTKE